MESVDLDMNDLFDVPGDIDEDAAFPASPRPFEDNEAPEGGENEENEEGDVQSQVIRKLRDMSKGAGKKVIRNPQPKLDADRLNGDRGIPVLPKIFKEFKTKGPGHEIEDLHAMMRKMEHWAHRLFPKMTFDEVIERVERLGVKKAVQTTVKKIRLDIPLLDNEFVSGDEREDGAEEVVQNGNNEFPEEDDLIDVDAENVLDEMLRDDAAMSQSNTPASKDKLPDEGANVPKDNIPSTPILTQTPKPANTPSGLTDEMREKIERNKRLAMEKRQAKLQGKTPLKPSTPSVLSNTTSIQSQTPATQVSSEKTNLSQSQKEGEASRDVPSEDDLHLFMEATLETEFTGSKSKQLTETLETEKGKEGASSVEGTSSDLHLFVEPTLATEQEKKNERDSVQQSEDSLRLEIEPTVDTSSKVAEPKDGSTEDDMHLFIHETKTSGESPNNLTLEKDSNTTSSLEETQQIGQSEKCEGNVGAGDIEMTEGQLHLFLEETESKNTTAECGVVASGNEGGTNSRHASLNNADDSLDNENLCLRIDSTEESQEEDEMEMAKDGNKNTDSCATDGDLNLFIETESTSCVKGQNDKNEHDNEDDQNDVTDAELNLCLEIKPTEKQCEEEAMDVETSC